MKIKEILSETPIETYGLIGDFSKSHSFRKPADRALVSKPRFVERTKNVFAKSNHDMRFYFANTPEGSKFTELGTVDMPFLKKYMPKILDEIEKLGGFGENSINIIYTNNKGAQWYPMTPWIMAHRMGHAIFTQRGDRLSGNINKRTSFFDIYNKFRSKIDGILSLYNLPNNKSYEKKLLCAIGTTGACRDNNLREPFEFIYECFAQYLITGEINFNPLPKELVVNAPYGRLSKHHIRQDKIFYADTMISDIYDNLYYAFEDALSNATGKIMVM